MYLFSGTMVPLILAFSKKKIIIVWATNATSYNYYYKFQSGGSDVDTCLGYFLWVYGWAWYRLSCNNCIQDFMFYVLQVVLKSCLSLVCTHRRGASTLLCTISCPCTHGLYSATAKKHSQKTTPGCIWNRLDHIKLWT